MQVQPIAGALGAEISGVDLAKDLSDATVAEIRRIWLEHLVVFFRDQELPPARFLAFARRFGTPIEYPFAQFRADPRRALDPKPTLNPARVGWLRLPGVVWRLHRMSSATRRQRTPVISSSRKNPM